MVQQSDVRNLQVLRQLHGGLTHLSERMDVTAQDLRACLLAVDTWIRSDRPSYWKRQTRLAEQHLNEALDRLQQKQSTTMHAERPPATEEKKQVTLARARLNACRQRAQACRKYLPQIEDAIDDLAGPLAEINETVETEIPQAMRELMRMLEVLERYTQSTSKPAAGRPREEKP